MPSFSWTVSGSSSTAAAAAAGQGVPGAELLPRDLELDDDGDLLVDGADLVISSGQKAIEQDLASRLRIIRGEFFLDRGRGVPYLSDVWVKNPNLNVVRSAFRDAILGTPGILEITQFALTLDTATRTAILDFTATTDFGEIRAETLNLAEV